MRNLFISILLLSVFGTRAQNQHGLELSADYGFLFLHSQDLAPIGQSYPVALSFNYSYWLLDKKHWDNCHCFPRIGASLGLHEYGNSSVLGIGIPLYAYLEPWYQLSDKWYLNLRGGAGLSYNNRPYHPENNPMNLSYSLPINAFVTVGLGAGYQATQRLRLSLQARYNHVSNGSLSQPNKGLNYPSASLSADYGLRDFDFSGHEKNPYNPPEQKNHFRLLTFASSKTGEIQGQIEDRRRISYLVAGAELRYSRRVNKLSAITLGGEYINNQAYRKEIERKELGVDHQQLSLLMGHEFLLGRFVFSQQIGVYIYKQFHPTPGWYQRYGLHWYPLENFSIGTNIKVHGHVAEFLDARIGYAITF